MRKADLISEISDKTGIPKVDVMFTLETMFKEIKQSLIAGENIYIRGFGSFITKKRAAKIGRNIKKNVSKLENSISRGDVKEQQIKVYNQLSSFWEDSVHLHDLHNYYTSESAKLVNSEKNLTFAAQLMLSDLR